MPGIRRIRENHNSVGVVYSRRPKEEVAYCQRCLENNIRSKLGNRVYNPEQSIPPDYNSWRQCHLCGSIYGRYETKQEAELYTLTEPRDNPFKFKSGSVNTEESRKFDRTGKTQHKRMFKQDLEQYKEEDVKEALRKGSKLVSYTES